MKYEILETKVLYENEHSAHNYIGWPTVARLKNGALMMAASGFRVRHVCPFGKVVACLSYNEGETWTPPMVIIDTLADDRDAGVLPFGESSVMVMNLSDGMEYVKDFYEKLDDKNHPRYPRFGRYKEYVEAYINLIEEEVDKDKFVGSNFRVSHDNGLTYGPIHRVPPMIPHGPCLLPDGRIFGMGNTRADGINYDRELTCWIINPDTGESELVSTINADDFVSSDLIACEPYVIVTKTGKMIAHIRVQNADMSVKTTYQCESYDLGKTWTKPYDLYPGVNGPTPTHILQHSSGALIAVHAWREEFGINAMVSYDDGVTWEKGISLYRDDRLLDWSYPSTCELSDGTHLTVFYGDAEDGDQNRKGQKIWQVKWKLER